MATSIAVLNSAPERLLPLYKAVDSMVAGKSISEMAEKLIRSEFFFSQVM